LHFYRNFVNYQNQVLAANATGLPQSFEQDELLSNMVQFAIYYLGQYYDITLCVYYIGQYYDITLCRYYIGQYYDITLCVYYIGQ